MFNKKAVFLSPIISILFSQLVFAGSITNQQLEQKLKNYSKNVGTKIQTNIETCYKTKLKVQDGTFNLENLKYCENQHHRYLSLERNPRNVGNPERFQIHSRQNSKDYSFLSGSGTRLNGNNTLRTKSKFVKIYDYL